MIRATLILIIFNFLQAMAELASKTSVSGSETSWLQDLVVAVLNWDWLQIDNLRSDSTNWTPLKK